MNREVRYPVGYIYTNPSGGIEKLEWRKSFGRGIDKIIVEIWSAPAVGKTRTYEIIPFYPSGERGEICPEYKSLENAIKVANELFE